MASPTWIANADKVSTSAIAYMKTMPAWKDAF